MSEGAAGAPVLGHWVPSCAWPLGSRNNDDGDNGGQKAEGRSLPVTTILQGHVIALQ